MLMNLALDSSNFQSFFFNAISFAVDVYAVFGLQGDHLAMLLLTLMTVEMHVMQFVNWMVCSE